MEPALRLGEEVEKVLGRLRAAGIRASVVGGMVRDALLGRESRDVDLVVECTLDDAKRVLPEALRVSRHVPVLLVPPRHNEVRIEITGLRGGASSLENDLLHRDFTINAIAFDPESRRYLDPLGGRADLAARRLRSPLPERSFRDDPARVLRGIRLSRELHLGIDPATRAGMERDAWRLEHTPRERVRGELFRLLRLSPASESVPMRRLRGAVGSTPMQNASASSSSTVGAATSSSICCRIAEHASVSRPAPGWSRFWPRCHPSSAGNTTGSRSRERRRQCSIPTSCDLEIGPRRLRRGPAPRRIEALPVALRLVVESRPFWPAAVLARGDTGRVRCTSNVTP